MIVLDTHVLVWWVGEPDKLSSQARRVVERAAKKKEIVVSSISIWEIAMLIEKGRLKLTMDVEAWTGKLEALPFVQFVPVDNRIALRSVFLPGTFHADPADRLIIATARELGASLVTSDQRIRRYQHVRSIW